MCCRQKIPINSGFVKKTDYNATVTEIEYKLPIVSGLDTTAVCVCVCVCVCAEEITLCQVHSSPYHRQL